VAIDVKKAPELMRALQDQGIDTANLSPIGVRPRLGTYLADLWERRHFIWMDARHRVATQNSRNRLGNAWLLLRPLLDAGLFFVIFGVILSATRTSIENYAAYIVIGVLMFQSTMRSIAQGPSIMQSSKAMVRAFSFPRAALPISAEIRDTLQMVYTVLTVLILIVVIPPHEWPQWTWLLIAPIFVLQFALNLGISFITARIGYSIPDIAQVMSVAGRFLLYGSGVIFPIDRFVNHPIVVSAIEANPIYQFITMYRQVLMDGTVPSLDSWLILGGWAFGLLVVGFLFFWLGEASYGGGQ